MTAINISPRLSKQMCGNNAKNAVGGKQEAGRRNERSLVDDLIV